MKKNINYNKCTLFLSAAILIVLSVALFSPALFKTEFSSAFADDEKKDFHIEIDGMGTANEPYLIKTAEQLLNLQYAVNGTNGYDAKGFSGQYFALFENIDMSDHCKKEGSAGTVEGFSGIGTSSSPFKGSFDGRGNSIKLSIHVKTIASVGLFSFITSATIKNLAIDGYIVTEREGANNIGSLFGEMREDGCTIDNITVRAEVKDISIGDYSSNAGGLGGLISINYDEDFKNAPCVAISNINVSGSVASSPKSGAAGGVVGRIMKRNQNTKVERIVVSVSNVRLISSKEQSARIVADGKSAYAGGITGYVGQNVYFIAADLTIPNVEISAVNSYSGLVSGGVREEGLIVIINCSASHLLEQALIDRREWAKDRQVTFNISAIKHIKKRNVELKEKIDIRDQINNAIKVTEEEIDYNIACSVKHTEDKCLTLDFNTKLIVQGAGTSIVVTDFKFDSVIFYSIEFKVTTSLALPVAAKIAILAAVLLVLVLLYQLIIKKRYKAIAEFIRKKRNKAAVNAENTQTAGETTGQRSKKTKNERDKK